MISRLEQAEAKVVGYASFFFEPQVDPGLVYIHKLAELYQALPPPQQQNLAEIASVLGEADDALNSDRKLAAAVAQAGNVALPMLFTIGEPRGNPDMSPEQLAGKNIDGRSDLFSLGVTLYQLACESCRSRAIR